MKYGINEDLKSQENEISKDEFVTSEYPPGKILEIPQEKKEKEISFKEYEIKGNNNIIYDLKIFKNQNSISFHIKGKSFFNKIFKKEITLEEFYNLNRFFRQYLSLEDLFDILFKNLKISEISISEISENNNKLKLILIIEIRGKKEEIPIILEQNQSESENLIFNLSEHIREVELQKKSNENVLKEFKIIKEKLNKLNYANKLFFNLIKIFLFFFSIQIIIRSPNKPMKPIKNEIDNIKDDIEKLKLFNKEIEQKLGKKLEKKLEKFDIKSRIVSYGDLDFVEEELQRQYKKNIVKYELLFRASRDGFRMNDFQNKCNGRTLTITIVKTKNNRRFGGFTKYAHNSSSRLTNKDDFTFSLDNRNIYYYEENNNYNGNYNNNYNNNGNVLFFRGRYGFTICENSNSYRNSQDYSNSYSYNNINSLSGNTYFLIEDYEVFTIHFE